MNSYESEMRDRYMGRKPKYGYLNDDGDWEPCWEPLSPIADSKTEVMTTHLHYSDPTARTERCVFGKPTKGLFYNYSDRLCGDLWRLGWDEAKAKGLTPGTALFFEYVLNRFHDSDNVNLQHVILGCNMSNGYEYLVFGYTYTSKSNQ